MPLIPVLQAQRGRRSSAEFKTNQIYIVSSRAARTMQRGENRIVKALVPHHPKHWDYG